MPLYICRSIFRDQRPEPHMMIITRFGDSPAVNTGSYTAIPLTSCQAPRKAMHIVIDTRGYLIPGRETVSEIAYLHF